MLFPIFPPRLASYSPHFVPPPASTSTPTSQLVSGGQHQVAPPQPNYPIVLPSTVTQQFSAPPSGGIGDGLEDRRTRDSVERSLESQMIKTEPVTNASPAHLVQSASPVHRGSDPTYATIPDEAVGMCPPKFVPPLSKRLLCRNVLCLKLIALNVPLCMVSGYDCIHLFILYPKLF